MAATGFRRAVAAIAVMIAARARAATMLPDQTPISFARMEAEHHGSEGLKASAPPCEAAFRSRRDEGVGDSNPLTPTSSSWAHPKLPALPDLSPPRVRILCSLDLKGTAYLLRCQDGGDRAVCRFRSCEKIAWLNTRCGGSIGSLHRHDRAQADRCGCQAGVWQPDDAASARRRPFPLTGPARGAGCGQDHPSRRSLRPCPRMISVPGPPGTAAAPAAMRRAPPPAAGARSRALGRRRCPLSPARWRARRKGRRRSPRHPTAPATAP